MSNTILSYELEAISLRHELARLIRKNPIYMKDGSHDDYLIAEIQTMGYTQKRCSIERMARKVREIIKKS